ncbi:hypothetical protein GCM10027176_65580 [Actinoallomurus bryophytorum]|uniref:WXG100 family type VII secretion target n=1 Tax=Actinoallomurus bryophytorum TaxID=1490222 RepID=A0A543CGV9_9ACTN|nr:WXG100 family type VII secretion target [Actinoallomurus bryophytorum]TQL96336.1 WXG100 family type VII secretion target [Actinoallomurus bryophytorum]
MSGTDDGYTQVHFGSMAEAEEDFKQAYRALREELDSLDPELRRDLAPWVGKANSAYEVEHTNWTNAADDMALTIQSFGSTLTQIHGTYQDAENAATRLWSSS